MIIIKSPREVGLIRESARVVALVFDRLEPLIKPGVSTKFLNDEAEKIIRGEGAIPSELGYYGYPASICASVNETILHGIPSEKKVLRDGDIITIDDNVCVFTLKGTGDTFSLIDEDGKYLYSLTTKTLRFRS